MAKVSVIIVTWNAEKFIRPCLDSVFSQPVQDMEVIVFDNGSRDSTITVLEEYGSRIVLLRADENKGFCFANNRAIEKASGDFIFTLNSDIVLKEDYLPRLLEFIDAEPRAGMVQGKFLRMDKQTIDGFGLHLGLLLRMFNIGEGKKDRSGEYEQPFEIFGPCAAAALYRRELIRDVSLQDEVFDESFFFLVEDFDLAWRARHQGWKAMCVPQAICYHYRESSPHKSVFRQYLSLRNRYYLLVKNFDPGPGSLLRLICAFFLYDLPRLAFLLFLNPGALRALRDLYEHYPELRDKRRLILADRKEQRD